jgi:hypothetical protein
MTRFRFAFTSWLLAGVVAFAGCGGGDEDNAADDGKPTGDDVAGDDGGTSTSTETADAAIMAVFEGLKADNPRAAWDFLPASYQKDVNGLVHEFAGKMDAELWSRSFGTLRQVVHVLKTKKEFILSNPALQGAEDAPGPLPPGAAEDLAKNWDGILNVLNTLLTSEISDLEKLKTADMGDFVGTTGGSLMKQIGTLSKAAPGDPFESGFKAKLAAAKATVISSEGDKALVRLESPDEESKEVELVRVEGKWIPKDMADGWEEGMSEARASLAALDPKAMAAQKEQVLAVLDGIDATLGKLDGAKTTDEFNLAATEAMAPIMGMLLAGGLGGPLGGPSFPSPGTIPDDAVMIEVVNEIAQEDEEALQTALEKKADDVDVSLAIAIRAGKSLKIEVSPVEDVAAFAKKIDFGKVLKVDVEKRTITIDTSKPASKSKSDEKKKPADKPKPESKDDGEKKPKKKAA